MFEMIFNRTSLTRFCLNLCFKSLKLIIASTHVLLVSSSDRGACASGTGISRFTKLLELPVQLLHLVMLILYLHLRRHRLRTPPPIWTHT